MRGRGSRSGNGRGPGLVAVNARERFLATLEGGACREPFLWESGILHEALVRWWDEGLPRGVDVYDYFGLSRVADVSVHFGEVPPLAEKLIRRAGDEELVEDEAGGITLCRGRTGPDPSGHVVRPRLRDRTSWRLLASRLDPDSPERRQTLAPLPERRRRSNTEERWLGSGFGASLDPADGFPTVLRILGPTYWLINNAGYDGAALLLHDDPALVTEIYEHLQRFVLRQIEPVMASRPPDAVFLGEEAGSKGGPIMSPPMYRKLALPSVAGIVASCRSAGVRHVIVESGGDVTLLLAPWREAGVTGITPVDVTAGMDPVRIAREHPGLSLIGGICRTSLQAGEAAIRSEIETHARPLCRRGGAIPCIDAHFGISRAVSFDSMRYYRRMLAAAYA